MVGQMLMDAATGKAGIQAIPAAGDGRDDLEIESRRSGLGALVGYGAVVGVGAGYGLLRARGRRIPVPVAAVGLGIPAMAGGDVPIAALGVSDPHAWGAAR